VSAIDIKSGPVKDILSLLASNFRPVRSHLLNGVRGYARTPFSCSKVSGERNKSLTSSLHNCTAALPFTELTACSERSDRCCIRQVFVGDIEFEAAWNLPSHSERERNQNRSKPLPSGTAG
jgi:hypothetical protein